MFDLLIVGGGIHGTLLQLALKRAGAEPVVIDAESAPLAVWKRNTAACGMRYLRSSSSHNLELDFHALRRFARRAGYEPNHFIAPYMRPSLELFNDHADSLIGEYDLSNRIIDRIREVRQDADGFVLSGVSETYSARRVILAPGTPPPVVPWPTSTPRALHVFDSRFDLSSIRQDESIAVVGCGVTGGQLVASLFERGLHSATLIDVTEPTMADYDGNPCFVGPKCADKYESIESADERRKTILRERYPGTLPRDIYTQVSALKESGALRFILGRVIHLSERENEVEVSIQSDGESPRIVRYDRVIAATGFSAVPPARELIEPLSAILPTGPQGFPYPREDLSWTPGLYLAGALAELRLGPPARNIIGGHLAARRIIPSLGLDVEAAKSA